MQRLLSLRRPLALLPWSRRFASFRELGVEGRLCDALREMGIDEEAPMPVQEKMLPLVLGGGSALGTAPTGTGKTLAFLLPVVQAIRRSEAELVRGGKARGAQTRPGRPACVVLAPSRELASQVTLVLKALSRHAPVRSVLLTGAGKLRRERDGLAGPVDIVVGTPGRLQKHVDAGRLFLSSVRHVVVDEVR